MALRSVLRVPPNAGWASVGVESFGRLAGDVSDEFEVLVDVQHDELAEFGGGGDQHVRDR